jgi:hypothetical protein
VSDNAGNDAGDDEVDASNWLAGQFDPTGQVPKQPAPAEPQVPKQVPPQAVPSQAVPPQSLPPQGAPPRVQPPSHRAPAGQPPLASAPAPNTQGGFNWGLRPGAGDDAPAAPAAFPAAPSAAPPVTPTAPPAAPPKQPTQPPAFQAPATTPYQAPATTPYQAPATTPYQAPPEPTPSTASPTAAYPAVPPLAEPAATAPFTWVDFAATQAPAQQATQPPVLPPAQSVFPGEQPTEAYTVQPWEPTQPAAYLAAAQPGVTQGGTDEPQDPTSAIDALFGDQQFQEYEEVGVLKTIQTIPGSDTVDSPPKPPRDPITPQQRVLLIVAGALVAVLALVALFFAGTKIGSAQAAPTPAATAGAPSSAPTSAATGGTAAPGVQPWTALQGGECIQPFTSPWVATFTVVDCTVDHQGEMVFKGTLPDVAGAPYPNGATFATEITPLCSASTAINYTAASAVTDLQVSFSYPANSSEWASGDRTYYCFVNRSSGGNLPGDLSVTTTQ